MKKAHALATTLAVALLVSGCGSSVDTTTTPPAPGTVTLELSGVSDAGGMVVLSMIGRNLPQQPVAAACGVVDADPYAFSGKYFPIAGPDPCTLESNPTLLQPGDYDILVAVMPGGSTVPEQCAETRVTVDGDTTVVVDALGPGSDCEF